MSTAAGEQRRRLAVILWGVLGVVLVLVEAIYRLAATAVRIIDAQGLTAYQQLLLAAWTVAICYFEGYRGFQQRFSPRVVARALYLAEHRRALHVILAPIYCMALFHTTRRRLIATWALLTGIVALVLLVRQMSPPYRAIVDAGVACALAWGTISMLVFLVMGLTRGALDVPPEVPEEGARSDAAGGEDVARGALQAGAPVE